MNTTEWNPDEELRETFRPFSVALAKSYLSVNEWIRSFLKEEEKGFDSPL